MRVVNVIIIIIIGSILAGCRTQQPTVVVRDSVRIIRATTYRDTTLFITLPGEVRRDTIFVDSTRRAVSELNTYLARSRVELRGGSLVHELMQRDTTLARLIRNAIRETTEATSATKVEVKRVEVNNMTRWQSFWMTLGQIFVFFLAFLLLLSYISGGFWLKR
jgi:hypothetical protein